MRISPYFLAAGVLVAVGGALVGAAVSTAPVENPDRSATTQSEGWARDRAGSQAAMQAGQNRSGERAFGRDGQPLANHYPLEADGRTVDVNELRERGLYSQDRYADNRRGGSRYEDDIHDPYYYEGTDFGGSGVTYRDRGDWRDRREERASRPARARQPRSERGSADRTRTDETGRRGGIRYVSRPVVQDTSNRAD